MHIANTIAAKRNKAYNFQSAGTAVIGSDIDLNIKRLLKEIKIETDHTPAHVSSYDVTTFDEIHVMTNRQKYTILSYYKDIIPQEKIIVLDIEDPFGKGFEAYKECKDKLIDFYSNYIV